MSESASNAQNIRKSYVLIMVCERVPAYNYVFKLAVNVRAKSYFHID